ncbi:MAG: hypothetical protein IT291_10510 [Deltaproteobacteria bacterium]|nr:hypothetical protein [Deltaproteobacteria bacterium]
MKQIYSKSHFSAGSRLKLFLTSVFSIMAWLPTSSAAEKDMFILGESRLRVAIPYLVSKLDILNYDDPVNRLIIANLGAKLTRIDANGSIQLDIASSFAEQDENKTWEFAIRPNLRFADNRELTATDIKKTFEFLIERATAQQKSNSIARKLQNIKSIRVSHVRESHYKQYSLDNIKFHLQNGDKDFLTFLSQIPIIDTRISKNFGELFGSGTLFTSLGPYQLRENRAGEIVVLERSDYYFRPGFPRAALVEFVVFEDDSSALSALRVGAVDIIPLATEKQLDEISTDPTLVAIDSPLENIRSAITTNWLLERKNWSKDEGKPGTFAITKSIVRKNLKLDDRALGAFDLSGTFLR